MRQQGMLAMIHHVHHVHGGGHVVHHCGGNHRGAEYTVVHCSCGLHAIDTEYLKPRQHSPVEMAGAVVRFSSPCPAKGRGWWHVESGRVV